MTKETYWQQVRGALIAMVLTILVLPILGIWAVASQINKWLVKLKPKGG